MKKTVKFIEEFYPRGIIALVVVTLLFWVFYTSHIGIDLRKPKAEVGQIWVLRTDDPFDDDTYYEILDVLEGYVLYKRLPDGIIEWSDEESWFKRYMDLYKDAGDD